MVASTPLKCSLLILYNSMLDCDQKLNDLVGTAKSDLTRLQHCSTFLLMHTKSLTSFIPRPHMKFPHEKSIFHMGSGNEARV